MSSISAPRRWPPVASHCFCLLLVPLASLSAPCPLGPVASRCFCLLLVPLSSLSAPLMLPPVASRCFCLLLVPLASLSAPFALPPVASRCFCLFNNPSPRGPSEARPPRRDAFQFPSFCLGVDAGIICSKRRCSKSIGKRKEKLLFFTVLFLCAFFRSGWSWSWSCSYPKIAYYMPPT